MSIQSDKYKALRTGSKTTLINLANKYNFPIPKNLKSLIAFGKRLSNHIEKLQYQDYESAIPEKNGPSGLYKTYLRKSRLHDTTQSKQNFKDIEEFSKIANEIDKELNNFSTKAYMSDRKYNEFKNIVGNKTNVKNFIKNTPKEMLRYSPLEDIKRLEDEASDKYLNELCVRFTEGIKASDLNKLFSDFNSKNFSERFSINQKLYKDFYEEYERLRGHFNAYQTLKNIIERG